MPKTVAFKVVGLHHPFMVQGSAIFVKTALIIVGPSPANQLRTYNAICIEGDSNFRSPTGRSLYETHRALYFFEGTQVVPLDPDTFDATMVKLLTDLEGRKPVTEQKDWRSNLIEECELSVQAHNALEKYGIQQIGAVERFTSAESRQKFGDSVTSELIGFLRGLGGKFREEKGVVQAEKDDWRKLPPHLCGLSNALCEALVKRRIKQIGEVQKGTQLLFDQKFGMLLGLEMQQFLESKGGCFCVEGGDWRQVKLRSSGLPMGTQNILERFGIKRVGELEKLTRSEYAKMTGEEAAENMQQFLENKGGAFEVEKDWRAVLVQECELNDSTKNALVKAGVLHIGAVERYTSADFERKFGIDVRNEIEGYLALMGGSFKGE